mmetsp:Transcript_20328/g.25770  ORF Transcript_20328/g.25770 Transcript_20328/m.25770 type:complete len:269 (-) Transcript_20328:18-824(-)
MELGVRGQHVLVTGASGGIGLETARKFLKEGSFVTCHFQSNADALSGLMEEFPGSCWKVQANATVEADVERALKEAVDKFGTVHTLVANHAIFPPNSVSLKDMSLDQFKHTLDVNLNGIFLFTREWMRQLEVAMNKKESLTNVSCVLIGSTSGLFGEVGHVDYSCSKSALTYGFCKTLKNELPLLVPNARVNVVAPGWVKTPMAQKAIDEDPACIPKALQTVALRKIATPDDVANSIVFLASSAAGHVSGCILDVHGGMEGRCLNPLE